MNNAVEVMVNVVLFVVVLFDGGNGVTQTRIWADREGSEERGGDSGKKKHSHSTPGSCAGYSVCVCVCVCVCICAV